MSYVGLWNRRSNDRFIPKDATIFSATSTKELLAVARTVLPASMFSLLEHQASIKKNTLLQFHRLTICKWLREWTIAMQNKYSSEMWPDITVLKLNAIAKALGVKRALRSVSVWVLDGNPSQAEIMPESDRALAQRCAKRLYDWFLEFSKEQ